MVFTILFCLVLIASVSGHDTPSRLNVLSQKFANANFEQLAEQAKIAVANNKQQRRQGQIPTPPGYPENFKSHTFTEYVYKPDPQSDYYAEGFTYHGDALLELRNDMEYIYVNDLERDFTSSKTLSKELIHDITASGIGNLGAQTSCSVYEHMPDFPIPSAF